MAENEIKELEPAVTTANVNGVDLSNYIPKEERLDVEKLSRGQKIGKFFSYLGMYTLLVIVAILVIFPFYWMINSSLKDLVEYKRSVPTFWPEVVHFENYAQAFTDGNLGSLFMNTLFVGVVSTLLSLVITIFSAFAFARLEFKGRDLMFGLLLMTMMIPGELFTITNYETVVHRFQWGNTFTAMIVPFLVSVFYIYLLRQNFKQVPNELYLAAKVDGTSDFKYLIKVMIPLALPTIITITILKMMGSWNSYIWPQLVANDDMHKLITNGLRNAFTTADETNYPVQMAAVAIVSAPLFVVFLCFRKYIMRGVSRSGIKG